MFFLDSADGCIPSTSGTGELTFDNGLVDASQTGEEAGYISDSSSELDMSDLHAEASWSNMKGVYFVLLQF